MHRAKMCDPIPLPFSAVAAKVAPLTTLKNAAAEDVMLLPGLRRRE